MVRAKREINLKGVRVTRKYQVCLTVMRMQQAHLMNCTILILNLQKPHRAFRYGMIVGPLTRQKHWNFRQGFWKMDVLKKDFLPAGNLITWELHLNRWNKVFNSNPANFVPLKKQDRKRNMMKMKYMRWRQDLLSEYRMSMLAVSKEMIGQKHWTKWNKVKIMHRLDKWPN